MKWLVVWNTVLTVLVIVSLIFVFSNRSAIVKENEYRAEIAEVMQEGFDQQQAALEQLRGVIEEVLEYLNQ
jgi:hypothetical protein